jgi:hypothetical protein
MTPHFVHRLPSVFLAALAAALLAPALRAQNQIVLGDSPQSFTLQAASSTTLQMGLEDCSAGVCTLASGSAYGDGVFASSGGQYALTTAANNAIVLTVSSDDTGGSFAVTQSAPIEFSYASSAGSLSGNLTLTSLDQGNTSMTATLAGELAITGGSMAQSLASNAGSVSMTVPLGGYLASLFSTGGSLNGEIGYPSTVTLAPAAGGSCPVCRDFITSGGWITAPDGDKGTFGAHGGLRNGAFWGHVEYNDHGSAPPMTVKSESITNYAVLSADTRQISGTCEVNGHGGYTFTVTLTDADNGGEGPGPNHADSFSIQVSNGYSASGNLGGGDVEIHRGKCEAKLEKQGEHEREDHARCVNDRGDEGDGGW